jgi:hypothetical protein
MTLIKKKYTHEVGTYTFGSIGVQNMPAQKHEFTELKIVEKNSVENLSGELHHLQRSNFTIEPAVKERRGIGQVEKMEMNAQIEQEVSKRLAVYQIALEEEIRAQVLLELKNENQLVLEELKNEYLSEFVHMVEEIKNHADELMKNSEKNMLHALKNICQWLFYKNLDDDYVKQLMNQMMKHAKNSKKITIYMSADLISSYSEMVINMIAAFNDKLDVAIKCDDSLPVYSMRWELDAVVIEGDILTKIERLDAILTSEVAR